MRKTNLKDKEMKDETRYSKGCLCSGIKIVIIIFMISILSCKPEQPERFEKPFIIIEKCVKGCLYNYAYQDKNGKIGKFDDDINKYSIGDTIK
jgi:hypothetical protein